MKVSGVNSVRDIAYGLRSATGNLNHFVVTPARMRIAKDLHDGLGGLLSTAKARLTTINNEVKKIESYNIYEKTTSMVDEACDEEYHLIYFLAHLGSTE